MKPWCEHANGRSREDKLHENNSTASFWHGSEFAWHAQSYSGIKACRQFRQRMNAWSLILRDRRDIWLNTHLALNKIISRTLLLSSGNINILSTFLSFGKDKVRGTITLSVWAWLSRGRGRGRRGGGTQIWMNRQEKPFKCWISDNKQSR